MFTYTYEIIRTHIMNIFDHLPRSAMICPGTTGLGNGGRELLHSLLSILDVVAQVTLPMRAELAWNERPMTKTGMYVYLYMCVCVCKY